MSVRTRFAPSPTGYLHVGGARTALFNWLFARQQGGVFVLRVEDTDKERNTEEARLAIFEGMKWLGMDWDEGPGKGGDFGPYYQSQRKEIYDRYFEKLVKADRVYESDGAWRFRFERMPITMNDMVCGEVTIDYRDESNTPDMVVKRSDGSYVFHFVNVVDDLEMKISHVIRGEDHLMNTPKHLQLIEAFGGDAPAYAHIPLILNADGSKMSKRDEGAAVGDYLKNGYLSKAVTNFLALLGWNPKTEDEVFNVQELVERFSLHQVNRAPARFDIEKCQWMNQQHITVLSDEEFAAGARPLVEAAGLPVNDKFDSIAAAVKRKVRLLSEVPAAIDFILTDTFDFEENATEKVKKNRDTIESLGELADNFETIKNWNADTAKDTLTEFAKTKDTKAGKLMFPLRVALSGRGSGPDLDDIFNLLGQERCVARMRQFSTKLKGEAQT